MNSILCFRPSTSKVDTIVKMIDSGMDVARILSSHGEERSVI